MGGVVRGEGNRLVVMDAVAMRGLLALHNNLIFPKLGTMDYARIFEGNVGDRITVKKAYQAFVTRGKDLAADGSDISPLVDETVELQIRDWVKFSMRVGIKEQTLDIRDFIKRYVSRAMEQLGIEYDQTAGRALARGGSVLAMPHGATLGSVLTPDKMPYIREHAADVAFPADGNNFCVMNYRDAAAVTVQFQGDFDKSGKFNEKLVGTAVRENFMGKMAGFDCFSSVHVPTQEVVKPSGWGTPRVNGANQNGKTINIDGFGAISAGTVVLKKGTLISFQGAGGVAQVGEVRPRSFNEANNPMSGPLGGKQKTGRLATFTVAEDVVAPTTANASVPVKISPGLNDGNLTALDGEGNSVSLKAFQNVTNAPADNAAVKVHGLTEAASGTAEYRQTLLFHRKALHFVPIHLLQSSSDVLQASRVEEETQLQVLVTQWMTPNTLTDQMRGDSYFAVDNLYPEITLRYFSSAV